MAFTVTSRTFRVAWLIILKPARIHNREVVGAPVPWFLFGEIVGSSGWRFIFFSRAVVGETASEVVQEEEDGECRILNEIA